MASINKAVRRAPAYNNEGTRVVALSPLQELKRAVLSTFLWEDGFYEDGVAIADRIESLVSRCKAEDVAALAIQARNEMKLRHVPLLLVRFMAKLPMHRFIVADTLFQVIQRPDELTEFLALYWQNGRCPLAKQVQRGLARAFNKFDAFTLAKYNRDGAVKLRDVAFLAHVKPSVNGWDEAHSIKLRAVKRKGYSRGAVLRHKTTPLARLIADELPVPDTWETAISAAKTKEDKDAAWSRLLDEDKLGALALLRNLRNLREAGISDTRLARAITGMKVDWVLPFRFIAAARFAPSLEDALESAMFRCLEGLPKLEGKTALIIDTSPSMWQAKVSEKSEMTRFDAAAALAILAREMCESVAVFAFNEKAHVVPPRRGFALRDALERTKGGASCGGLAVEMANQLGYDRIIVLTDGEWHYMPRGGVFNHLNHSAGKAIDVSPAPLTKQAYMINVSNTQNGVGYGKWTSIDGWSEAVLQYVAAYEQEEK